MKLLEALMDLARQAGDEIMQVYATDFAVRDKRDASPVTDADERAERVIIAGLRALASEIPIVAEEAVARAGAPEVGARFWLVDPLDGTREFASRNGEFTVNIALIEDGRPRLGVVYAPVHGRLFAGEVGQGAVAIDRQGPRAVHCRVAPQAGLAVLASRSHGDEATLQAYLSSWPVASIERAGSSLKLCLLAAGEADLYPRLSRTMEWDIAAGHGVLAAAGGDVFDLQGQPLRYGKPGFENPGFVACTAATWLKHAQGKPGRGGSLGGS